MSQGQNWLRAFIHAGFRAIATLKNRPFVPVLSQAKSALRCLGQEHPFLVVFHVVFRGHFSLQFRPPDRLFRPRFRAVA